ncbi:glucose 1-dehydrogenase [Belnapia sp. T6]|uniref:Glucose 1-dehydrogenase n=1 Tax=Belnapia mucosa TaxID=2804532 RepID=A0ABS1VEJ3_9PROT|nr:glucose 1-dehydrogenase [Belnapia mucosa]MBL6458813.1 glucose 1-dehydrogenase [Belnapia mucosa]
MSALAGKVALITGASRGIGRATAEALAGLGAEVFLVAEGTEEELEQGAAACRAAGQRAAWGVFDLADPARTEALVAQVQAELGRIDILVNNAGLRIRRPFGEFSAADFDALMAVNLRAPFLLSQAVLPAMRRQGGGRIIHVASQMGLVAAPTSALYGMAKAALIHLTKSMAVELAADGISVNCVSPGPIETEFTRHQMELRPGYREAREAEVPLRRWGAPGEVAELIGFLASTSATFLHGSNLLIDGGYTAH